VWRNLCLRSCLLYMKTGQYLTAQLKALQTNHSCLGDVRGCGLFQGIEFVDGESGEPDESAAQGVVDFLQSIRIISSRGLN
jgi:4-aminobutyrate aminotransferase-like enzyme